MSLSSCRGFWPPLVRCRQVRCVGARCGYSVRMTESKRQALVDHAIISRRSVRAFRPDPVPRSVVAEILDAAARAPSGTNMQPWRGYVLVGSARDELCAAVQAVFDAQESGHRHEVQYYPDEFFEPYLSRRRKV